MKKEHLVMVVGVALAVLLIIGAFIFQSRQQEPDDEQTEVAETASDIVVTLEEFGDYQCPTCAQLHSTLKELKIEFGQNLNFVFRNFPVTEVHKNALAASKAAEAARRQNRFWEMHDLLYQKQSAWKDKPEPLPDFLQFAKEIGLNVEQFQKDMNDEQVQFRIQADIDEAARRGVDAAPAIFINGRRLRSEAVSADGIRKGIELTLAREDENLQEGVMEGK